MARINYFDASIPGQSLTDTPGNAGHEHPPQFSTIDKALDFIFDSLMRPKNLKEYGFTLKNGAIISEIAQTVLFSGFNSGKWTVDMAMLMYEPLVIMLAGVAKKLGMTNVKLKPDEKPGEAELAFKKSDISKKMKEIPDTNPTAGLMSPPEGLL